MTTQTTPQQLADILHNLWLEDSSEDMSAMIDPWFDAIHEAGYRYKASIDESSPAYEFYRRERSVMAAFIEHVNSEKAYNEEAHFAYVCGLYIEKNPTVKKFADEVDMLDFATALIFGQPVKNL